MSADELKTVNKAIEYLNMAINAENDVFGWHHNDVQDTIDNLYNLLMDNS